MAEALEGYDENIFQEKVPREFHCIICLNVLKDPVLCRRNEHHFCRVCILRHLQNSHDCPICKDELTPESLTPPPRVLVSYLCGLNVQCDYSMRGCRDFVPLEHLEVHVENCGFAPVICPNQECRNEINRRDIMHHQSELCEYRKVKCHECSAMRAEIDLVHKKLDQLPEQRREIDLVNKKLEALDQLPEQRREINEMKAQLNSINEKLDRSEENQVNLMVMKGQLDHVVQMTENISLRQERNEKAVNDMIKNEVRTQLSRNNVTQDKELKEIEEGAGNGREPKIIVAGGLPEQRAVEFFQWSKMSWTPMKQMKQNRCYASSVAYNNEMLASGGGWPLTKKMERVKCDSEDITAEEWVDFPAELPTELLGHTSAVYNDSAFIIGGYVGNCCSNNIYEASLKPPYRSKLLTKMLEPRYLHGSQLIDEKLLVCGGSTSVSVKDSLDTVCIYDVNSNECQMLHPLPYKVQGMGIVRWGQNVVITGGCNLHGRALNTAFIYDVHSGKSYFLPEMHYKRFGCVAVVLGRDIVVMGGEDDKGNYLNSVERFTFESYTWQELPPMNRARYGATAVVI